MLDACHEFSRPPSAGKQGNSLETLRSMVASGMGISVLPASALTPRHSSPLIRVIDIASPRPVRRIVAAFRTGFPRVEAVRLIAAVVSKLGLPVTAPSED